MASADQACTCRSDVRRAHGQTHAHRRGAELEHAERANRARSRPWRADTDRAERQSLQRAEIGGDQDCGRVADSLDRILNSEGKCKTMWSCN